MGVLGPTKPEEDGVIDLDSPLSKPQVSHVCFSNKQWGDVSLNKRLCQRLNWNSVCLVILS